MHPHLPFLFSRTTSQSRSLCGRERGCRKTPTGVGDSYDLRTPTVRPLPTPKEEVASNNILSPILRDRLESHRIVA